MSGYLNFSRDFRCAVFFLGVISAITPQSASHFCQREYDDRPHHPRDDVRAEITHEDGRQESVRMVIIITQHVRRLLLYQKPTTTQSDEAAGGKVQQ